MADDALAEIARTSLNPFANADGAAAERAALDRIASRIDTEIVAPAPTPVLASARAPRRKHGRPATLFAAAAVLVIVSGAAIAAPAAYRTIFGSDPATAANQVEAFQHDAGQLAQGVSAFDGKQRTPDDHASEIVSEMLLFSTSKELKESYGEQRAKAYGNVLPEYARVLLVDGEGRDGMRIVAAPTDRGNLCAVRMHGLSSAVHCLYAFDDERQIEFGQSIDPDRRIMLTGLASDDVAGIRIQLASGPTVVATMGTNAFAWRGEPNQRPIKLLVDLEDGTVVPITPPNVLGMVDDPDASYSPDPDRIPGIDSPLGPTG